MENFCRTCKIEIPLMGLTGRKRAFCGDKCKLFYTNHIKHFDIALATSDASYCTTEDDCRSWASIWCLDSKKAFRRKVLEHKFSIGINLEDFISKINSYIDNHPTNEFLTKRSQQFNAWYSNTIRKICPVCTKKYPSFNQTKWRVYCSEKCCNIAKRSGGAIRDTMDETFIERYGVKGGFTKERMEEFAVKHEELHGVRNSMQLSSTIKKSMETRKANGFSKISKAEIEIKEFIESLGLVVESNVWNVIERKELDLYVHSKKIAIEYNGCFFHSEGNGGEEYAKLRHVEKTNLCEEKNIQLIHIWEDEWTNNKGTVLNMLKAKLGMVEESIYARKTKVVKDCNPFDLYNKTHIQGNGSGSKRYGLELDGELVAAMSFIRRSEEGVWELNRYASKNVVGGFSKLLSAFKKDNKWVKIVSFGDRCVVYRHSNTYTKNGFKEVGLNPPDYKYTKGARDRHHKFGFRKNILAKKYGFDLSMTEHEMASELGYKRIYNSGLIKYELENK